MADYVGDELLGQVISNHASMAHEINLHLSRLANALQGKPDAGMAQEYATWHSEEILENMLKRTHDLSRHIESVREYSRTAVARNR